MSDDKLKVVFIAGCGRSGTTVLGQLLGEVENFVNIGEAARYLFDRAKRLPCGCGLDATACPFWQDIIAAIPEELTYQGAKSLRVRTFPSLFLRTQDREVPEKYRPILDGMADVYRKVAEKSGSTVIVDTSKYPSTGLLAGLIPDVELHVVHVVRSPHSVVASWTRKNGYLAIHPPQRVVAYWWAYNLLSEALKSRAKTYRLVRYEDFAREPGVVLESITADVVGRPVPLPFLNGNRATVHVQHSLAGNPAKFNTGEIKIQDGNGAVEKSGRKLWMNLATFPLQRRYQYMPAHQNLP
jgi:hypothetical protein